MDFTSKISLATSIIELIIASWMYIKFKRTSLSNLFVTISILLGLYHFSEYLICNGQTFIWPNLAFICATFVPTLFFYYSFILVKKIKNPWWLFIPAFLFSFPALIDENFSRNGECSKSLVAMYNLFFSSSNYPFTTFLYFLYFFVIVPLTAMIFYRGSKITRNVYKKYIFQLLAIVNLFLILIPSVFQVLYPELGKYNLSFQLKFLDVFVLTGVVCLYLEQKFINSQEIKKPGY